MTKKGLLLCILTAFLLRLAFIFVGFPHFQQRWQLREDGDGYGLLAQSIREGRYTDVQRSPLYPAFVALAGSPMTVKVWQAVLDTVTAVLVFLIARRNVWAAWLWAIYPFAIWRVAFINKEVVLTFLLACYVWMQLVALREGRTWPWLGAGALLGLLSLCKTSFLPWPVAVVALLWWKRLPVWRVMLLAAAMAIVVAPWTLRNYIVTGGQFLPVATEHGGATFFLGNYRPNLGMHEGPNKLKWMAALDEIKQQNAGLSVVELDRLYYRKALEHMKADPLKTVELAFRKCGRFWFLSTARRAPVASVLIQGAYLALALWGLTRLRPWGAETLLMLAMIFYTMAIHAVSYADMRYSLPLMPLVCALASRTFATRAAAKETS